MRSGDERGRTADLLRAKQTLSQTELHPHIEVVGLSGIEPETSRLSGARSNRLSYKPWKKLKMPIGKLNSILIYAIQRAWAY